MLAYLDLNHEWTMGLNSSQLPQDVMSIITDLNDRPKSVGSDLCFLGSPRLCFLVQLIIGFGFQSTGLDPDRDGLG